jgi:cytoskeletal protein CcmA (bactofilin family)
MADDMKHRFIMTVLFVGSFLGLIAVPAIAVQPPVITADRAAADIVLVQSGDVVTEDLYAVGNRVVIEGTVEGDVLVASTGQLLISGHVTGSVTGIASSVEVSGTVDGSVRVAAATVRVDGQIGEDLFAGASNVVVTGGVGRDLLAWCISLNTTGSIGRNVSGQSYGSARIGGTITGDVELTTNRLNILAGTTVGGTLAYRSSFEATIGQGVTAGRQIVRREPVRPNVRVGAIFELTRVVGLLSVLIIGLLLFWAAPRTLHRAVQRVRTAPLRTLLVGVAAAIVPPLVIGLAAGVAIASSAELALPALVVGGPIAVTVFGLIGVGLLLAPVPVLTGAGGRLLGWRRSGQAGFILGAVLWVVLLLIPVVRTVVLVATAFLGLGAWASALLTAGGGPAGEPGAIAEAAPDGALQSDLDDQTPELFPHPPE